ncbi:MAG TPA: hypothetical protein VGS01_09795 [Candidatus Limnocylindria bacterium]|nr:hypothetical protein [Candidatus Limnocylindria bacterium]
MTTPSEQWIVSALRQSTDRMPLPPESRWVRERRSTPHVSTIAVVGAAAIFAIVVAGAISGLRVEPRVVPAASADAFAAREDAQWASIRYALPSDLVMLRPTWIPAAFRGSADCPSPSASFSLVPYPNSSPAANGYFVVYQSTVLSHGRCGWLLINAQLGVVSYAGREDGLVDSGTVDARGAAIHVRIGTPPADPRNPQPPDIIDLWWNESGATYEVISNDLELADLVRIVRSLEPAQ